VLQQEVMQFAQEAAPSEIEEAARKTQLSILEGAVHAAVGRGVKVMLFGSARAGLALHSSDLDVMITGACERPSKSAAGSSNSLLCHALLHVIGGAQHSSRTLFGRYGVKAVHVNLLMCMGPAGHPLSLAMC
jgi:predicted nucleotidyltransferase